MDTQQFTTKSPGILGNRFIRTIILSNVLLQIGIWVRNFAILLYVSEKTNNDPYAVSLISVVEFAPIFVFSFIGGTFADRWKPKRTMIWCDLLSAVSVFVVLMTILLGAWQAVYLVTFISAILSQFSQPSAMRLFKQHVPEEQLQQGMALFQSLAAIFMVLGPMLGTFVYTNWGLETSISIMGVAFLLSALVLVNLPKDKEVPRTKPVKGQFLKELAEGFRYVWRSQVLRTLGVAFMLAGLGVGLTSQAISLFVVTERLGKPEEFLQYLFMTSGAAMLIGGGVVAAFAKRISPQFLFAIGSFVSAICTFTIGLSTNPAVTLTAQFISGFVFPCIHIGFSTMILKWSNEAIVGRVMGVLNPMFMGMMVLSMSFAGLLKDLFSLVALYTAASCLYLIGALVMLPVMKHKAPKHHGEETQETVQAPSPVSN